MLLTPHSAHFSAESYLETKVKALEDAKVIAEGGQPRYAVNEPRVAIT